MAFIHAGAGKGASVICQINGHTFYMRNVVCIYPVGTETDGRCSFVVKTTGGDVTLIYGHPRAPEEATDAQAAHRDRAKLTEALAIQSADEEDVARSH